ncbi:hCG2019900, isoform CRA_d, partial [Homo sapiens]
MAAANKGNKPRVRSIRFAAGHDAEGSHSHVHFDEKLHDSVVMVTQESDSSFLVKVGFLKILHRYEITFTLPPVHRLSKDVREAPVPSLHLKLLSVVPVPEGYSVKCEYSAHKEGVLKEEILLACEGGTGTCVRVTVQARVMGESVRLLVGGGMHKLDCEGFCPPQGTKAEQGILARLRGSQPP